MKKIFIYGYGNPGRQDDGLGPALIEILEKRNIPNLSLDSNYQLNIEDAYDIAQADIVVFVDASLNTEETYTFTPLSPSGEISFSTHAISAGSVLALCEDLYGKSVEAYILAIRGYEWDYNEPMTESALKNLDSAVNFIENWIAKQFGIDCVVPSN